MRRIVCIAALLSLTACETDDDFWGPVDYVAGGHLSFAAAPPPPEWTLYPDAECYAVAKQREADGIAFGYDEKMQHAILAGTYTDCTEWKKQHPFR